MGWGERGSPSDAKEQPDNHSFYDRFGKAA